MKSGVMTTEFWAMILSTVVGVGVMSGLVEPSAKDTLVQSLNALVGATMAIVPIVSYIASRTWLKAKTPAEVVKP